MTAALTLYTHPMSRGRIARWMLEETGKPYDTVVLDYGTTMKAPDYLALNPMGKVPTLRHGDHVVTECAAICTYLADAREGTQMANTIIGSVLSMTHHAPRWATEQAVRVALRRIKAEAP